MKAKTLARLELLAAERELQSLEMVRRQNAALAQSEAQRGMLASYRDRLAASWQSGAVVAAGQARRAGQFSTASHGAEAQIGQAAQRATEQLESALDGLAQAQAKRRALREAMHDAARVQERKAEAAVERDLTWRGQTGRSS
jgi:hypothetical protein